MTRTRKAGAWLSAVRALMQRPAVRRLLQFSLIILLALILHALEFKGVFSGVEGRIADWYLNRTTDRAPIHLITLAIDDEDYRASFSETSPLDAVALHNLVESIRTLRPRMIGVDILTESKEFATLARNKTPKRDETTLPESKQAKRPDLTPYIPIVWAASAHLLEQTISERLTFRHWLAGGHEELRLEPGKVRGMLATDVPEESWGDPWGVPAFLPEEDRAVRRLPRRWLDEHHRARRTFAGRVANVYCQFGGECPPDAEVSKKEVPDGEVFISSGPAVPLRPDYFVRDLFTCQRHTSGPRRVCEEWAARTDTSEPKRLEGSIVLLGGTFDASRDFFATPAGQRVPGLMLNAHAIRAEIYGPQVREFSHVTTLVLDVVVGLLIWWTFGRDSHLRIGSVLRWIPGVRPWLAARGDHVAWRVVAILALGFAAAIVSYAVLFPYAHILWLSWIPMLLTGLTWHIVLMETRHMRLKH